MIGPALAAAGLEPRPVVCPLEARMGRDGRQLTYP